MLGNTVIDGLRNHDAAIRFELEVRQLSEFYGDAMRLQVVLNNLISNAIKYQKSEGEDRYVRLTVDAGHESALIRVSDNGIGISEDHLENIFKLFFRTENSQGRQGTGIGLYIVKESVEKMGGTIQVYSSPGEGTTFEIAISNKKNPI